jgi:hypothetical protein
MGCRDICPRRETPGPVISIRAQRCDLVELGFRNGSSFFMGWVFSVITWRPRIGDPNPMAWGITAGYFLACWFCFSAGRKASIADPVIRSWPPRFWYSLAALMFFMGWNKQLDLQTLLTQVGRQMARDGGWYAYRKPVQVAFICICTLIGLVFLTLGLRFVRGRPRQYAIAYLGIVYLVTFIVIRAASFHRVDYLLFHLPVVGNWLNTILEVGGVCMVSVGGFLANREIATGQNRPRSDQAALAAEHRP